MFDIIVLTNEAVELNLYIVGTTTTTLPASERYKEWSTEALSGVRCGPGFRTHREASGSGTRLGGVG